MFGWVALIAAFAFQALALNKGQISIVRPVLATELVFMLGVAITQAPCC
jgi:hypothetical protein